VNNIITIGGLLLSIGVLFGFVMLAAGLMSLAAQSMSDAPDENPTMGCVIVVASIVFIIGCVFELVR
jgi:hypothetical protein